MTPRFQPLAVIESQARAEDPAGLGVPLFAQQPAADPRLTFSLSKIPVEEALKIVAALSDTVLHVTEFGVELVPK